MRKIIDNSFSASNFEEGSMLIGWVKGYNYFAVWDIDEGAHYLCRLSSNGEVIRDARYYIKERIMDDETLMWRTVYGYMPVSEYCKINENEINEICYATVYWEK